MRGGRSSVTEEGRGGGRGTWTGGGGQLTELSWDSHVPGVDSSVLQLLSPLSFLQVLTYFSSVLLKFITAP